MRGIAPPLFAAKRTYTWTCTYCGKEFETEIYSQRYCSPAHKQRAYELRKTQRRNAGKQPEFRDGQTVTENSRHKPEADTNVVHAQKRGL